MMIGTAAAKAGVNVQTIRYYERRGLLPRGNRRESGYRDISADAVRVIRFIKRAQNLGFSLHEIEALLQLARDRPRQRTRIRAVAESHLLEIEKKLAELGAMRHALATLIEACAQGGSVCCPIIEALDGAAERGPS